MARVVVLDVDGTLMDTNYLHTEAGAQAFEAAGLEVPPRVQIHKLKGKGSDLLVGEFVEDEEAVEKVTELHSEIYSEMQRHGYPLPGAKELIQSLSERGYEVWFVTSAKDEELELHKERLEPEGKIAGIVNSSQVENPKPAPDIFEETLRRTGAKAEDIVSVGDAVWDVEGPESGDKDDRGAHRRSLLGRGAKGGGRRGGLRVLRRAARYQLP